jgi:ELWxxDGT repeat protein
MTSTTSTQIFSKITRLLLSLFFGLILAGGQFTALAGGARVAASTESQTAANPADGVGEKLYLPLVWRSTPPELSMVRDINPAGSSYFDCYDTYYYLCPTPPAVSNGNIFFLANDGLHGGEWWKSDGTEAGTVMVKDINPGEGSSKVESFTAVHDSVFFSIGDQINDGQLWNSDGTLAGTVMLKGGFTPWIGYIGLGPLVAFNGNIYFDASTDTYGRELWKSDGTVTGTTMVTDIEPGSNGSYPVFLVAINNTLFFSVTIRNKIETWKSDIELWKSDGTEAGTVKVKGPFYSGSGYTNPIYRGVDVNGVLFFAAGDGIHGIELWKSDGTEAGTVMVKDINPGVGDSVPGSFTVMNGILYFTAGDGGSGGLWKSDGTEAGTVMVKDTLSGGYSINWLTPVGDTLYFVTQGYTGQAAGQVALWKSDGSESGTTLVKDDFLPIGPSGEYYGPYNLTNINGVLVFAADDARYGRELWASDGTPWNTFMIADIDPAGDSSPSGMTLLNDRLLFFANDGVHGIEPWSMQWLFIQKLMDRY